MKKVFTIFSFCFVFFGAVGVSPTLVYASDGFSDYLTEDEPYIELDLSEIDLSQPFEYVVIQESEYGGIYETTLEYEPKPLDSFDGWNRLTYAISNGTWTVTSRGPSSMLQYRFTLQSRHNGGNSPSGNENFNWTISNPQQMEGSYVFGTIGSRWFNTVRATSNVQTPAVLECWAQFEPFITSSFSRHSRSQVAVGVLRVSNNLP